MAIISCDYTDAPQTVYIQLCEGERVVPEALPLPVNSSHKTPREERGSLDGAHVETSLNNIYLSGLFSLMASEIPLQVRSLGQTKQTVNNRLSALLGD